MPDDAQQLADPERRRPGRVAALGAPAGPRVEVTDVEPLTGGTQNIVVRLHIDGRPMVLRRPPVHPRPTSDKTMLREIAALRTLAGTPVPHPGFIAGCDDLDVLGVVFYLMEEVDGFNPGDEHGRGVRRVTRTGGIRSGCRTRAASPSSATSSGRAVRWRSSSGRAPFWSARFRSFCGCWKAIGTSAIRPNRWPSPSWPEWLEANRPPRWQAGNHARRPASEQRAAAPRQARSWRRSSTGRCAPSATRCWTWAGC